MEEQNEIVEPVVQEVAKEAPVSDAADGPDFVAGVNRILTALLSGILGSALLLFGLYFGAQLLGEDLGIEGQFSIQFLLLSLVVIFLSLFIAQILMTYFSKLIEKDNYKGIGAKLFVNLMAQLVALIIVFPFTFIFLAFSKVAVAIVFAVYFIFSTVLSAVIREEGQGDRLLANLIGLFVATLISMWIFFGLGEAQVLMVVIVLPIALVFGAIFELLGAFIVNAINK